MSTRSWSRRITIGLLLLVALAGMVALATLVSVPAMLLAASGVLLLAVAGFAVRTAGRRVDRILGEELDH